MIRINRPLLHTALWLPLILVMLASCTQEYEQANSIPPYSGERVSMNMQLNRNAANADEAVVSARIIVFTNSGELVTNELTKVEPASAPNITIKAKVARGLNRLYLFCNENEELAKQLSGLTQEDKLKQVTVQTAGISLPLPMFTQLEGMVTAPRDASKVEIEVNGVKYTNTLPVKVNRLMAKLNFTAIKNITEEVKDFTVEKLSIRICRMPKNTPLQENRPYTEEEWAENITFTETGTLSSNGTYNIAADNTHSVPAGVDKITFPDIYIPEHILSVPADADKATYMIIEAACRMKKGSDQLIHSIYTLNIGQNPPDNHNITRNNHYDIYATINGLGAMGIYAEIVSMDMHNIPVNWKPVEGLVIVSDKASDYDLENDTSKNVNIWNDYSTYSGILKVYHSDIGYKDILFKYGSAIAIANEQSTSTESPFAPPTNASTLNDILWYPSTFPNPEKISSWSDIPYVAAGDVPVSNAQLTDGLGDPCKLAGLTNDQILEGTIDNKQWRMPNSDDYKILLSASDGESNTNGFKSYHLHLLPNVKSRNSSGVLAATKNGAGNYWNDANVQTFSFNSADPSTAALTAQDPTGAYTVRCVRTSIPASEMAVLQSPSISYQGNTEKGSPFKISSNVPYWTATLIEDGSDPNVGTATDFDDFSFAPGETSVKSTSGSFTQEIPVYIKRKEITSSRTFNIRVTGMGYDGVTKSVIVTAKQNYYYFTVRIENLNPELSSTQWIPKAGGTYTFTLTISPTDVTLPAGDLKLLVGYHNTTIATCSTPIVLGQYEYKDMTITIPKNETPDVIGLSFATYINSSGTNTYGYKQDNK